MSDDKKYKVVRLANAPSGDPYKIERRIFSEYADVDQQVGIWWSSRGTLAIVVMNRDKEDSRYERDWLDRSRVPEGWEERRGPTVEDIMAKLEESRTKPQPDAPITAFNEDDDEPKTKVVRPSSVGACIECWRPIQDEPYPGDEDKSPSGRHNALRCGTCGHPEPGMSRRNLLIRHINRRSKAPKPETSQPQFKLRRNRKP
tara:strand:- start:111 stop:713 length:603 start_codon:yes stop_codon:yes gene_type:complete